jgi:hypothetical protein
MRRRYYSLSKPRYEAGGLKKESNVIEQMAGKMIVRTPQWRPDASTEIAEVTSTDFFLTFGLTVCGVCGLDLAVWSRRLHPAISYLGESGHFYRVWSTRKNLPDLGEDEAVLQAPSVWHVKRYSVGVDDGQVVSTSRDCSVLRVLANFPFLMSTSEF